MICKNRIKVVAVGGAGINSLERMVTKNIAYVDLIAIDSDDHRLRQSTAPFKVYLGGKIEFLRPRIDKRTAIYRENREKITKVLSGADIVFIAAGMGGKTGTHFAPIVAIIARELGLLTIAAITLPFTIEGEGRISVARLGHDKLRENVDALSATQNDGIYEIVGRKTPVEKGFKTIDDILYRAVKKASDLHRLKQSRNRPDRSF